MCSMTAAFVIQPIVLQKIFLSWRQRRRSAHRSNSPDKAGVCYYWIYSGNHIIISRALAWHCFGTQEPTFSAPRQHHPQGSAVWCSLCHMLEWSLCRLCQKTSFPQRKTPHPTAPLETVGRDYLLNTYGAACPRNPQRRWRSSIWCHGRSPQRKILALRWPCN